MPEDAFPRWGLPPGERCCPADGIVDDGVLRRVGSLELARQILRARDRTRQAGFTAERIPQGRFRKRPILISDGELHEDQRRKVARFFAPAVVDRRYGRFIESTAQAMVDRAVRTGRCHLDELALHYSVRIAARVVGLTAAPVPAMSRRLVAFFRQPPADMSQRDLGRTPGQWMRAAWHGLVPLLRFYLADVRPAIRDHVKRPRDDVIGHLIDDAYSHADILVECLTYGTAGMVTTREFIAMACWHLLRDTEMRHRYRTADSAERIMMLHEIIRLEPVVGHLYRRVASDFSITDGGASHALSAGDLVDIHVRQANVDPAHFGPHPQAWCPDRTLPHAQQAGLSFGDGEHRCPGQALAMRETDALLTRLLAHHPRIVTEPSVSFDSVIEGYRLRGFRLRFDEPPRATVRRSQPA